MTTVVQEYALEVISKKLKDPGYEVDVTELMLDYIYGNDIIPVTLPKHSHNENNYLSKVRSNTKSSRMDGRKYFSHSILFMLDEDDDEQVISLMSYVKNMAHYISTIGHTIGYSREMFTRINIKLNKLYRNSRNNWSEYNLQCTIIVM